MQGAVRPDKAGLTTKSTGVIATCEFCNDSRFVLCGCNRCLEWNSKSLHVVAIMSADICVTDHLAGICCLKNGYPPTPRQVVWAVVFRIETCTSVARCMFRCTAGLTYLTKYFSKHPIEIRFTRERNAIQLAFLPEASSQKPIVFPKSGRKTISSAKELLAQSRVSFPVVFSSNDEPEQGKWRGMQQKNPTIRSSTTSRSTSCICYSQHSACRRCETIPSAEQH